MDLRSFTSDRMSDKRPRQNFGSLYCPKCGQRMLAGSSPRLVTYYYCSNDHCNHSTKVTRPA